MKQKKKFSLRNKIKNLLRNLFDSFDKFIAFSSHLCAKLNRSQKYFYIGTLFFILTLTLYFLIPIKDWLILWKLTSAILFFGVISDLLLIYNKVWNTNIGKGIILIIYAFTTNLAYTFSSMVINDIVKFQSSAFTYSLNFVAVMFIPILLLLLSTLIFGILFVLSQLYMMVILLIQNWKPHKCFSDMLPKKIENYPFATFTARIIIYTYVFTTLNFFGSKMVPSYGIMIDKATKFYIYHFEAKTYSRCKLEKLQKVIEINDQEVVIVEKTNQGYIFKSEICMPVLNKKTTFEQNSKVIK